MKKRKNNDFMSYAQICKEYARENGFDRPFRAKPIDLKMPTSDYEAGTTVSITDLDEQLSRQTFGPELAEAFSRFTTKTGTPVQIVSVNVEEKSITLKPFGDL